MNGDVLTSGAGSGFTLRITGIHEVVGEDQAQLNPGTFSGTWTQTNVTWWTAILGLKSLASVGNASGGSSGGEGTGWLYGLTNTLVRQI